MPTASVEIDPTLPLSVSVDLQSKHRAGVRLFTKGPGANEPWVFLKEGVSDLTATCPPVARGSQLKCEFVFFQEPYDFRAILVFRQSGVVLPTGTVRVTAAGDALFISDEVTLR